uniref:BZIP domain-containing protein n=1 Tax=Panagrolaimus davidi TaxID=227884 RepID=A0A914QRP0_9BILA
MNFPSNNAEGGYGHDEYNGGFEQYYNAHPNLHGNTVGHLPTINQDPQHPDHFQNSVSNDLARDINFAYESYGNQSSYGFGPNNYVSQYCDPSEYYNLTFERQEQHPFFDLQNIFEENQNVDNNINHPQQNQAEQPMNFEVTSINTQLSNESDNFIDDFVTLDISNNKEKDKLLSQMTDDEICAASGNFNPFCVPVTPLPEQFEEEAPKEVYKFNQDPEIVYDAHNEQNAMMPVQNQQPFFNPPPSSLNQSNTNSENNNANLPLSMAFCSTKKPGPGRPPKYDKEDRTLFYERTQAKRESSKKYERRIKQEKDAKRQKIENTLVALNAEHHILSQRLIAVTNQSDNYFKTNLKSFNEEQLKIYYEKTKMMNIL